MRTVLTLGATLARGALLSATLVAGIATAQNDDPENSFKVAEDCPLVERVPVDFEVEAIGESDEEQLVEAIETELEREFWNLLESRLSGGRNEMVERVRAHICPAIDRARDELAQRLRQPVSRWIGRVCLLAADYGAQQLGLPDNAIVTTVRLTERAVNALCPSN